MKSRYPVQGIALYEMCDDGKKELLCQVTVHSRKADKQKMRRMNVVRLSVTQCGILNMASRILRVIQDYPDTAASHDFTYEFTFPLYGAVMMRLEFSGRNMCAEAYDALTYLVAKSICDVVAQFARETPRSKKNQDELLRTISEMRNVLEKGHMENAITYDPDACSSLLVADSAAERNYR